MLQNRENEIKRNVIGGNSESFWWYALTRYNLLTQNCDHRQGHVISHVSLMIFGAGVSSHTARRHPYIYSEHSTDIAQFICTIFSLNFSADAAKVLNKHQKLFIQHNTIKKNVIRKDLNDILPKKQLLDDYLNLNILLTSPEHHYLFAPECLHQQSRQLMSIPWSRLFTFSRKKKKQLYTRVHWVEKVFPARFTENSIINDCVWPRKSWGNSLCLKRVHSVEICMHQERKLIVFFFLCGRFLFF